MVANSKIITLINKKYLLIKDLNNDYFKFYLCEINKYKPINDINTYSSRIKLKKYCIINVTIFVYLYDSLHHILLVYDIETEKLNVIQTQKNNPKLYDIYPFTLVSGYYIEFRNKLHINSYSNNDIYLAGYYKKQVVVYSIFDEIYTYYDIELLDNTEFFYIFGAVYFYNCGVLYKFCNGKLLTHIVQEYIIQVDNIIKHENDIILLYGKSRHIISNI